MRKIVGIVFIVLALISGINVVRQLVADKPARLRGNEAYERGRVVAKFAPILLLGLGVWMLRRSRPAFTLPPAPIPSGSSGSQRAPSEELTLRGGPETFASNPAQLHINFGRWLAVHPAIRTILALLTVVGVSLLFVKYQVGLTLLLSGAMVFWQNQREIKHKYLRGDVCAAEVLSAPAGLVAVYTDLTTNGAGPHPAIKIIKQPLQRMNPPAADGMRLAAVAVYGGDVRNAVWNDFAPEVIHCVIADAAEIERVMRSIPEDHWQALGAGLSSIPVAQPGLYPLWQVPAGTTPELPPMPWLKRSRVRLAIMLGGFLGAILIVTLAVGWWNTRELRKRAAQPGVPPPAFSQPPPQRTSPAAGGDNFGAYKIGQKIEANWAGGWIPGMILEPFGMWMSYRVQLNDPRFRSPMVLSTNLLRPQ